MVDQLPRRTLVVFGLTGAGKSYSLNLLSGEEDPDKGYFDVGTQANSVTYNVSCFKTKLYGNNQPVLLIDVPGLQDTSKGGKDLQTVQNLEAQLKLATNLEYTAALMVLNSTNRLTEEVEYMIKIVRCFFSDDRIIPVFSKCGSSKKQMQKAGDMADSYIEKFVTWGNYFPNYILIGEERDEDLSVLLTSRFKTNDAQYQTLDSMSGTNKETIRKSLNYYQEFGGTCFPGRASLLVPNGSTIKLEDIREAIPAISWKIASKKGAGGNILLENDRVLTFIHAGRGNTEYLQFVTENENDLLEISLEHLVYCKDYVGFRFKFSYLLIVGDHLVKADGSLAKISKINQIMEQGYYAPLTKNGTLVINGYLTSCYAQNPNHDNMHFFMQPLILYKSVQPSKTLELPNGEIHKYCQFLQNNVPKKLQNLA